MIELSKNRIINEDEIAYVEPKRYYNRLGHYIVIILKNGKEIELFYEDDYRKYWLEDIEKLKGGLTNGKTDLR